MKYKYESWEEVIKNLSNIEINDATITIRIEPLWYGGKLVFYVYIEPFP